MDFENHFAPFGPTAFLVKGPFCRTNLGATIRPGSLGLTKAGFRWPSAPFGLWNARPSGLKRHEASTAGSCLADEGGGSHFVLWPFNIESPLQGWFYTSLQAAREQW